MAAWTEIPDSNLEPNAPVRSVDHIAMRDNPIAIAEGAPGAPRIQRPAIASGAVDNNKIQPPTAGTNIIRRIRDSTQSTQSDEFQNVGSECHALVAGTIQIYYEFRVSSGSGTVEARVLRNGSQVEISSLKSNNFVSRTHNISVSFADVIQVQFRRPSGGAVANVEIRNVRVRSGSPTLAVSG